MAIKNWFKVSVLDGSESPYSFHGSSPKSFEQLIADIEVKKIIVLSDLVYFDRGDFKEWSEWDKSIIPSVAINSEKIISVMQYKTDPHKK